MKPALFALPLLAFPVLALPVLLPPDPPGAPVLAEDPLEQSLAVTVYNGNLGLVRDRRRVELESGVFTLTFPGVAALIDPTSVAFHATDAGAVDVLEQNYEFDLLTPESLLAKYVGEEVTLYVWRDEREVAIPARLLSTQGGAVYQIGDSIALNPPGRVVLPALKGDLKALPTLLWTLDSQRKGERPVEVSYLTGGLTWKADYVATLSADDRKLDLGGWVTVDNTSGATYPAAKLKLVAGDIHRAPREEDREGAAKAVRMADQAAFSGVGFEERTFFEYHLYDLPRPTTIKDKQTKQIRLLEASEVGTEKVFTLAGAPWYYTQAYGGEKGIKVGVYQEFDNRTSNGLGIALPAGVVRLYKADTDGTVQLVGEDRIDHTPRDERVRLKVGEAFDLVADRRQTDFKVLNSGHLYEESFEVVIRNHKAQDVTVRVVEPLPGDWSVLSSSHPYEKLDAFTVRFDVPVERGGETKLTYRIQIRV